MTNDIQDSKSEPDNFINKVGKKLYAVNGQDELVLHDGTKFNMRPEEPTMLDDKELDEILSEFRNNSEAQFGWDEAKAALNIWRDIAIAEARIDEAKDILANIADLGIEVYFARQRIGRHIVALQSQRDKLRKEKI